MKRANACTRVAQRAHSNVRILVHERGAECAVSGALSARGGGVCTMRSAAQATSPAASAAYYGRRREPTRRRWVLPVALAAVVAVMALLAVKLFTQYGSPQYSPTVLSLTNVTKTSTTVMFRVQKASPAAVCTVVAEAQDGSVLGTSDVPVPVGTTVTVTYTITTTDRPHIAEVSSCRAAN